MSNQRSEWTWHVKLLFIPVFAAELHQCHLLKFLISVAHDWIMAKWSSFSLQSCVWCRTLFALLHCCVIHWIHRHQQIHCSWICASFGSKNNRKYRSLIDLMGCDLQAQFFPAFLMVCPSLSHCFPTMLGRPSCAAGAHAADSLGPKGSA